MKMPFYYLKIVLLDNLKSMKILFSQSNSPYFNLAAEEYLFSSCKEDFLFIYVNDPSVIVGANQVIGNEVNVSFCRENNIIIARRISGGGTVFHDHGNLNYCFISNKHEEKSVLDTDFLLPVVEVLKKLNIVSEIGKRKDLWLPGGFKISGTASHISKNRILFHGTLLYDSLLDLLENALAVNKKDTSLKGIKSVSSPVKNIKNYLAENGFKVFDKETFFDLFLKQIADYFRVKIEYFNLSDIDEIKKISSNKIEREEWIYRK